MDPGHRDRIAFLRICSGRYRRGMRMHHVRLGKEVRVADALTFMAGDRQQADEACAGDIIGLHNHGTINIGDTFTEGEALVFTGIPNFAPEMFRRAVLKDPLKMKALQKGLEQLCEEGATQLFRPVRNNELILGAVGPLQFEVVAFRLAGRIRRAAARSRRSTSSPRAGSAAGTSASSRNSAARLTTTSRSTMPAQLVYLAPSRVNLGLTIERWPDLVFRETRETSRRRHETRTGSRAARCRLGALRLGQFRVRHHSHGRVLPGFLQAVLERRHRGGGQHVPARDAEWARGAWWSRCWRRCWARWRTAAARA